MKTYRCWELGIEEIKKELFSDFNRYQKVEKCWRKVKGEWVLKDIAFTENWGPGDFRELTRYLKRTIKSGGGVFGAFSGKGLIGFASLENEFFGSKKEYLQLSSLHISTEYRGFGIGKALFNLAAEKAKERRAKKLYISAHSSMETMAFYHSLGCVEAMEYNPRLVGKEPYDCQLEYRLKEGSDVYNGLCNR